MKYFYYIIFTISVFLNYSCGIYGFRGNNPPEGIKTLAVPLFQDISGFSEAGVKEGFTEALKNKIINDNTFVIADKNVADGILYGTITNVKDEALVISGNESVTKRKLTISVKVSFENLKRQKKIWEKQYDNWGEYSSSDASFSARFSGIKTAQEKICDDILIDITSNW